APTNAGSYTVIGTITAPNYAGGATNTLVVSAPPATVTLSNLIQTYNGSARTVSADTIPGGLSLHVTYNGSAIAPVNVGSYTVVALVSSPDYTGGATNTLVVSKGSQAINLELEVTNSIPLNLFTNPIAVTATASSGLPVTLTLGPDSAAVLTETNTLVNIQMAGIITILANQAGNANYQAAAQEVVILNVGMAPQTLTFEPVPDVPVTNGPIELNASASSGLGVTYTVVSGPAIIIDGVLIPTGSGQIVVVASQPGSIGKNTIGYNAAPPVTRSFNVTLLPQAIAFGPLSDRAYGSGSFALSATASSGLLVGYVSSDDGVVTISGSKVTLVSAGTVTITASQAGNGVYDPATNVSQVLIVNPGAATVALGGLTQGYNGTARSVTATPTPSGLAVSVTYDGWPSAPTNASSYSVVATITDPNYQGSSSATSRITPKALTVQGITAASTIYDGTTTAKLGGTAVLLTPEAPGAGNTNDGKPYTGDTVNLGGTAAGTLALKDIGTRAVTITGNTISGAQVDNYT
ncbi:MAG: MBG domain-containing protein, partial [Verrucomicrobiota bacterium]